ncbi:hypothetical protein SUGI_0794950 [Cryptomeria japonica]|nr:hypothetical protein SUGI_0794950 [Cryptomeria japonica]
MVRSFRIFKHLESLQLVFGSEIFRSNIEWNCLLKSVRELTNLQTLRLKYFKVEGEFALSNRGETTDDRFRMRSLEAITLCSALETKVSISGHFCPALKSLKLCSMKDLIEVDLTGLNTLECLVMLKCGQLRKVLANDLPELETFRIKLCRSIRELPNFGRVSSLKRIYISHCWNLQDISAIEGLKGLKRIWIAYCPELKSIKAIEQLKRLKRIWIEECPELEGVICFKELKELNRIFIGQCPKLQNIQGIEFLIGLESIIIAQCPKLQNITGIEELKGLKEMIIANSPVISCVERLQRLPSELTILVGRSALTDLTADEDGLERSPPSYFTADKIGDTLSLADGFCQMDCFCDEVEEMIHSSFSTFIFCAVLDRYPRETCNGTSIMFKSLVSQRPIPFSLSFGDGWMIYICVFNEERFTEYGSWMPLKYDIEKAFLMGVKEGEERKTLHILQSLSAQLSIDNGDYDEGNGSAQIKN